MSAPHAAPNDAADAAPHDVVEEIVPMMPIVLPIAGAVLMFLLAFIAQGLYEAHSIHTTNLAALRETERMGIEAATRTAAEERLTARWQYDRQLAVADLVFKACQTEAAATPATKPD